MKRKGCGNEYVLEIRVCDLDWPTSSSQATRVQPLHRPRWWNDPDKGPSYASIRAKLIRQGYRPENLEHDGRDLCAQDYWSYVCKHRPETVDCQTNDLYGYCDFAFRLPREAWAIHGPYLLVRAEVSDDHRVAVVHQQLALTGDLKKIWARKKLKERGCHEEYLLLTRVCDPDWSPTAKPPEGLSIPVLPPLPRSPR